MPSLTPVDYDPFEGDRLLPPPVDPASPLGSGPLASALKSDLTRAANRAVSSVKAPGKALREKLDPDEELEAAHGMAGLMGTGAFAAPRGAAGIFGGKLATTADLSALKLAEAMEAKGMPREQVWDATGWFRAPDQQWKFRIPDTNARSIPGRGKTMGEKLEHPELYKAYPGMENIPASYDQRIGSGMYQPPSLKWRGGEWKELGERIHLPRSEEFREAVDHPWNLMAAKKTALHELTHGVQNRQGWQGGGSPEMFIEPARAYVQQHGLPPSKADDFAYMLYRRLKSEEEAFTVEAEAHLTPEQLQATPPWKSYSIPEDKQIDLPPKFGGPKVRAVPVEYDPFQ